MTAADAVGLVLIAVLAIFVVCRAIAWVGTRAWSSVEQPNPGGAELVECHACGKQYMTERAVPTCPHCGVSAAEALDEAEREW